MIVFLNGKFVDLKKAKVSILDHGFLYGDGVFERTLTYDGKPWNLRAHISRLYKSAQRLRMYIPWKPEQVEKWVYQTLAKNRYKEAGIRITLTRGSASTPLRYDFVSKKKPTLCIVTAPSTPWPRKFYKKGIKLTTFRGHRSYPEVKTTSMLVHAMALQDSYDKGGKEAILVDCGGRVTECTSATVLFVKNGILVVPKAHILHGTTLRRVIQLAVKAGIKVKRRVVTKGQIYNMDECFITSVTRRIMPVYSIDGRKLRQKSPGRVTKILMERFNELVGRFVDNGQ